MSTSRTHFRCHTLYYIRTYMSLVFEGHHFTWHVQVLLIFFSSWQCLINIFSGIEDTQKIYIYNIYQYIPPIARGIPVHICDHRTDS